MKEKTLSIIFMAMLILLSRTAPAESETFLVSDYWERPWCDVNKTHVDDTRMCWAAVTANVLAWGGWGTARYSTAAQIFDKFKMDFGDAGGSFFTALDYWFNRVDGGGYFPGYDLSDLRDGGNVSDLDRLLTEGYALYTNIQEYGSHALSCWGYDYEVYMMLGRFHRTYTGIYYTDSNDLMEELKSASVRKGLGTTWYIGSGIYEDWRIMGFEGLRARTLGELQGCPINALAFELNNIMINKEKEVNELFFLRPFLSFDYKWVPIQIDSQLEDPTSTFLVQIEISNDKWLTLLEKNIGEEQGCYDWKSLNLPIDENFQGLQRLRFVVEGNGQLSLYRLVYVEPVSRSAKNHRQDHPRFPRPKKKKISVKVIHELSPPKIIKINNR